MSKRKKTPKLAPMDELLGGSVEESERPDSKESQDRVKVTYYLPGDLVDRINAAHVQLTSLARGSGVKINKYDMARVALEMALEGFEAQGAESELAAKLLEDA